MSNQHALVVGGPFDGQRHLVEAGSDRLEIETQHTEGGLLLTQPKVFVYKVHRLRMGEKVFVFATPEGIGWSEAINVLMWSYLYMRTTGSIPPKPEQLLSQFEGRKRLKNQVKTTLQ